jgi:hypothetical protein
MKYIITESRVHDLITKYFEDNFGDLNWTNAFDYDANETDCGAIFYRDYFDEEDYIFRFYDECWWEKNEELESKGYGIKKMMDQSPMLVFENNWEYDALNGYFGDIWEPIFKDWFKKKFGFQIKTISI